MTRIANVVVVAIGIVTQVGAGEKPDFSKTPGVVVNHVPASSGKYIGSPSLAVLPGGDYVASHDYFGPKSNEHVKAASSVFKSSDRGKSWKKIADIDGAFWSTLFVHRGQLYLLGPDRHHGNVLIRRSTDGGVTNGTKPSVTFNSGTLNYVAMNAPGAASSETVGAITLSSGQSTINAGFAAAVAAGATSTLTAASLARNTGATVNGSRGRM